MFLTLVAGLLSAVGTAASGFLGLAHGVMFLILLSVAAVAVGAGTALASIWAPIKKVSWSRAHFPASEGASPPLSKVPLGAPDPAATARTRKRRPKTWGRPLLRLLLATAGCQSRHLVGGQGVLLLSVVRSAQPSPGNGTSPPASPWTGHEPTASTPGRLHHASSVRPTVRGRRKRLCPGGPLSWARYGRLKLSLLFRRLLRTRR
jgi:hypothetical protein